MGKIRDVVEKWAWTHYLRLPRYAKLLICVGLVLGGLVIARNGIFGEEIRDFAMRILPLRVPLLDPPSRAIPLTLYANVQGPTGPERLQLGGSYPSDSEVSLFFGCGAPCWLMVLGVDRYRIYSVFPEQGGEPQHSMYQLPGKTPSTLSFRLDGTVGEEVFVAIASHQEFSYEEDVKAEFETALKGEGGRGARLKYSMELAIGVFHRELYFHTH